MFIINVYFVIGLSLYYLIYLIFAFKSRKPFKYIVLSALIGVSFLVILHFCGSYIGVTTHLNSYTLALSASIGIPGVIALLLANFIF